jgi:hypothetical protein
MRAKPRAAAALAAAVVLSGLSWGAAAQAGTQIPSGLVTPASVQQLQSDATTLDNASTDADRAKAIAGQALAAAKVAAQAAADKAAQTHDPADIAAAAAASAAQAAAQVDYDTKSATAAKAAADAATAADNLAKEKTSLNGSDSGKGGVNGGTSTESAATLPDTDPFPDNYLHSPNVQLISHVRGAVGTNPSCPAFNPTKCPGFSSLNFLHYENLGYDVMVANGTGGLSVWSLKDPAHPKYISTVTVAQLNAVSGDTQTQFWEGENETVDSRRKIAFMSKDIGNKGFFAIDLKNPWEPKIMFFQKVFQGHTMTCLDDCRFLWSVGGTQGIAQDQRKSAPVSVTDVRDPDHPFTYPAPIAADVRRTGSLGGSTHSVDVDYNGVAWVSGSGGVRGYWTDGKHFDRASATERFAAPYDPIPYAGGMVAGNDGSFLHNAYHFPTALGTRPAGDVMLITNENNDTNCATAGVFIISSLSGTYDATDNVGTPQAPARMNRLATFSVGGKDGEFIDPNRETDPDHAIGDCSAHWFTVKGNIVALGNYEQGTRFVDVSDPASPKQVGWFRVPVRAQSGSQPAIISSDTAAPYWHDRYVYVADYQRGIDVIKFNDPTPGTVQSKVCWNSCADYQTAWKDEFGGAGGTVAATLSLNMGPAASFGPFAPGVAHDYTATGTASVISTAGDAALSVADPSSSATGHLTNGTFSLPAAVQIKGSSAAGTGAASFADVGGSAAPTQVLTYAGPTSNDAVTMTFQQHIGSTDALRTGTYSKSLTFTLSTTNP